MKTVSSTDISVSEISDPIGTLLGKVIGILCKDGLVVRGRLIKADDSEIWLEKISGNIAMVARASISNIWVSRDCTNGGSLQAVSQ
jgi:hypothetical protein